MKLLTTLILSSMFSLIYAQSCHEPHSNFRCSSSEESEYAMRKRSHPHHYKWNFLKNQRFSLSRRDETENSKASTVSQVELKEFAIKLSEIEKDNENENPAEFVRSAMVLSILSTACYAHILKTKYPSLYELFMGISTEVFWNLLRDVTTGFLYPDMPRARFYELDESTLDPSIKTPKGKGNTDTYDVMLDSELAPIQIFQAVPKYVVWNQPKQLTINTELYSDEEGQKIKFIINPDKLATLIEDEDLNLGNICPGWERWNKE